MFETLVYVSVMGETSAAHAVFRSWVDEAPGIRTNVRIGKALGVTGQMVGQWFRGKTPTAPYRFLLSKLVGRSMLEIEASWMTEKERAAKEAEWAKAIRRVEAARKEMKA